MGPRITRRDLLRISPAALLPVDGFLPGFFPSRTRSFWLFQLLKPVEVSLAPVGTARLHCSNSERDWTIEGTENVEIGLSSAPLHIAAAGDMPVWCRIEIPDQMRREFFGVIDVHPAPDLLLVTLTTTIEVATSCIVGAEMPVSAASLEALTAQAVVSRSVLFATHMPRHSCAHFCDTTHCQFFRSPALPGSRVLTAVQRTRDIILTQARKPIAPRYSAACGGRTEAGLDRGVRYFSVICGSCRKRGVARRGHGWGLCQEGAMAMAASGASCHEILDKYYPATSLCAA
ncbi:MAG: hypothetical protein JO061_06280 [Acidobacteriaceae bacterium]|nr:hypothetical protein [Acidobacteriaceae bacterium]